MGDGLRDAVEHDSGSRLPEPDHINRAEAGVPTVITRNGAPVAAVVPIADFDALEEAADVMLAREAEAVLAEGGPTVTMAELLADLFTERNGDAS
ncbi:type II toxin-antitoxin system prevent-host-death family antitoxin [Streptomyces sp. NPDC002130]|uniref:type II toxin-antitoxin system prevent-host-death family antitoxin n=1 Tax=Streptomyces sp. NPDC002130 TaxID=3155568 RepID=UPI00331CF7B5